MLLGYYVSAIEREPSPKQTLAEMGHFHYVVDARRFPYVLGRGNACDITIDSYEVIIAVCVIAVYCCLVILVLFISIFDSFNAKVREACLR